MSCLSRFVLPVVISLVSTAISTAALAERMSVDEFFNQARYENLDSLCAEFYAPNVRFEDPLGNIDGMETLIAYYKNLYENVISIHFEPLNIFTKGDEEVFVWQMNVKHKAVGGGEPIIVDGTSLLRYKDGKVVYHRDYFDLGAMLYEQIPVLGTIIGWIKKRAHGVPAK